MHRNVMESLRLDASELHHLGPFLGFVGNELAELGGRASKRVVIGLTTSILSLRVLGQAAAHHARSLREEGNAGTGSAEA